jgi:hypothetical protein
MAASWPPERKKTYYDFKRGMSIKDVLDRWSEDGQKLYDPDKITFRAGGKSNSMYAHGTIPIRELLKYREYKRPVVDELVDSIQSEGFNTAIQVIVGKDGKAKIGEGNHRVVAAEKAGLKELPVYFHFYQSGA